MKNILKEKKLKNLELVFEKLGFDRSIWYDKNNPDSKLDDTKYCEYTLRISKGVYFVVTFAYEIYKNSCLSCVETTSELKVGEEYIYLPFKNIHQFSSMYKLLTGKKLIV